MTSRILRSLSGLAAIGVMASCDVTNPPKPLAHLNLTALVSSSSVASIVVTVSAPDIDPSLVFNLTVSNGVATGTIAVPAGSDRHFRISAFDAAGVETHRADATITVQSGSNAPLTVTLLPLTGSQPIVVTISGLRVEVQPTDVTMLVGTSTQFSARAFDGFGTDIASQVTFTWASSNPSVASIDSHGVVTAHVPGNVSIVAVAGGAAGVGTLTVFAPPMVETRGVTVPSTTATVFAHVNPNGLATDAWFEWGTSSDLASFTSTTPRSVGSGGTVVGVGANLSGLNAATPYYYRAAASNSAGTTKGVILNFTTGPVGDFWTTETSMAIPREYLGAATINGILYAVGGSDTPGSDQSVLEAYDVATGTWTPKAPMPTGRCCAGVAAVNGTLYAVGGRSNGASVTTVEAYDPSSNTWTTKASMPTARMNLALAAVNGRLYAVGGNAVGGPALATVEAYDPTTNAWTSKASMTTARYLMGVAPLNGRLYVVGGGNSTGVLATVEAYDPSTDTWTPKASMSTARQDLSAAAINGLLYAIGGSEPGRSTIVELYTPEVDMWAPRATMATARCCAGAAVVNGLLYLAGGAGNLGILATVEAYHP